MKRNKLLPVLLCIALTACNGQSNRETGTSGGITDNVSAVDSVAIEKEPEPAREILPADITLTKDLLYDQYTLDDTYPYKDTTRVFLWDEMKTTIAKLEKIQREKPQPWGILQNRRNKNGEAPLAHYWSRNEYKNVADSLGVERYQGIPLYHPYDSVTPVRYGRDGELVRLTHGNDSSEFLGAQTVYVEGDFLIPRKYVMILDTIRFEKIAFVDRTNQNIATVERKGEGSGDEWLVRSMNPATTGQHRPPYAHDTPLGIFVIQEKKDKMYYLVDGTSRIAGYAPWASRFTNGGYIHGVPTNNPNGSIIEYSQTLGTIPRSHMCVRNASSHAKFVYDGNNVGEGLVVVIE